MTQRKPLKIEEVKFVNAKVAGKSDRQAAKDAKPGLNESSLGKVANRLSTNVNIQQAIATAFKRKGITIDLAVAPIADGLIASKGVYKNNNATGQVEHVRDEPDHNVRLKASGMAFQLMGAGKSEGGDTINNFIIISQKDKNVFGL